MKPISLKTIGYICLKTGKFFNSLEDFRKHLETRKAVRFVKNLLKSSILEEKLQKTKDKFTTPFKRFCAKVKAVKAYKSWMFSLPRNERVEFCGFLNK